MVYIRYPSCYNMASSTVTTENSSPSSEILAILAPLRDRNYILTILTQLKPAVRRKILESVKNSLDPTDVRRRYLQPLLRLNGLDPNQSVIGLLDLVYTGDYTIQKTFISALVNQQVTSVFQHWPHPDVPIGLADPVVADSTTDNSAAGMTSSLEPSVSSTATPNSDSPTPLNSEPTTMSPRPSSPPVRAPILPRTERLIDPDPGDYYSISDSTLVANGTYIPLDQIVGTVAGLEPSFIGQIFAILCNENRLDASQRDVIINNLTASSYDTLHSFFYEIQANNVLMQRIAEILWDFGLSIYAVTPVASPNFGPEAPRYPTMEDISSQVIVNQGASLLLGIRQPSSGTSYEPNRRRSNLGQSSPSATSSAVVTDNNSTHDDQKALLNRAVADREQQDRQHMALAIIKHEITPADQVFIGNWLGLSAMEIEELRNNSNDLDSYLQDELNLVRATDGLKTRYGNCNWLQRVASLLQIRLGIIDPPFPLGRAANVRAAEVSPIFVCPSLGSNLPSTLGSNIPFTLGPGPPSTLGPGLPSTLGPAVPSFPPTPGNGLSRQIERLAARTAQLSSIPLLTPIPQSTPTTLSITPGVRGPPPVMMTNYLLFGSPGHSQTSGTGQLLMPSSWSNGHNFQHPPH